MNKHRDIKIEKITLNIGAGKSADKLEKGLKLLEILAGKSPVKTFTNKRIAGWGLRPGLPIGCKVIVRGKKADELLKQLLGALDNKLVEKQFDDQGNISFGIKEYIDIPDIEYTPDIGIMGLQVCVTLMRPGFRIKKRRLKTTKIGRTHKITKNDSIDFMKTTFEVIFEED